MKKIVFLPIALGLSFSSQAYCSKPYSTPQAPDKPICASMGSCSQWDIDNYNNQVRQYYSDIDYYNQQVQDYIDCSNRERQNQIDDLNRSIDNLNQGLGW